jgi:microcompartment protein CcmK/EutM
VGDIFAIIVLQLYNSLYSLAQHVRGRMIIALVIGSTIATIKDENLSGRKLLIVRESDTTGIPTGAPFVAVDTVSAGAGDLVLITMSSSARFTKITNETPVDAVIVGVIDSLEESGNVTYRKS